MQSGSIYKPRITLGAENIVDRTLKGVILSKRHHLVSNSVFVITGLR